MGISITFRHLASSDAIKGYVHEKLERVQKYLREPLDAHVILFTERHEHVAELIINATGRKYQAHHSCDDMYKSIDHATDKIEHQISKHHDAAANHKGGDAARVIAPQVTVPLGPLDDDHKPHNG